MFIIGLEFYGFQDIKIYEEWFYRKNIYYGLYFMMKLYKVNIFVIYRNIKIICYDLIGCWVIFICICYR